MFICFFYQISSKCKPIVINLIGCNTSNTYTNKCIFFCSLLPNISKIMKISVTSLKCCNNCCITNTIIKIILIIDVRCISFYKITKLIWTKTNFSASHFGDIVTYPMCAGLSHTLFIYIYKQYTYNAFLA